MQIWEFSVNYYHCRWETDTNSQFSLLIPESHITNLLVAITSSNTAIGRRFRGNQ